MRVYDEELRRIDTLHMLVIETAKELGVTIAAYSYVPPWDSASHIDVERFFTQPPRPRIPHRHAQEPGGPYW